MPDATFCRLAKCCNPAMLRTGLRLGFVRHAPSCFEAVVAENLSDLAWLRKQGFPWDGDVTTLCVRCGHLEMLRWALDNGCPYDKDLLVRQAKLMGLCFIGHFLTKPSRNPSGAS